MCSTLRQEQQQQQETVWLGIKGKKNVIGEDRESGSCKSCRSLEDANACSVGDSQPLEAVWLNVT